jgi:hypothetical protein
MNGWKPALALLLVFVAGMFVGVVGTRMVVRRVAEDIIQHPDAWRGIQQQRMELQLARQLHLGPVQRNRVREILAEMQGQLKLINQETQPRRQMILSNAAVQIGLILRPEQKIDWEKMKEQNRLGLLPQQPLLPQNTPH